MRSVRYRHLISIPMLALATTAGAQSSDDGLVDLATQAAARLAVIQTPGSGPRRDLTLADAIARALERNLDIAVERLNPQVVDLTLAQALSAYRPTFDTTFSNNSRTTPSQTQLDGGQTTVSDTVVFNSGISQAVQWGGGSYQVNFNNNRSSSTSFFNSFNPGYRSTFQLSYTQPLLRGFKIDSTRQQIQVTRINRDIADIDLRQTIANTVSSVQNAYWDLVHTTQTVAVQQQRLEWAETLVRENEARVEAGTLDPIQTVQARAEAAVLRQRLAETQQHLATAELALKRLIVGGTDDAYWAATLNPVDSPQLDVQPTQPTAAAVPGISRRIEAATEARELAEERLAIEQSRFAAGLQTNFFVVQAQRDLATAKDTELRAILDHQKALVEFERVQRTSLSQPLISIIR